MPKTSKRSRSKSQSSSPTKRTKETTTPDATASQEVPNNSISVHTQNNANEMNMSDINNSTQLAKHQLRHDKLSVEPVSKLVLRSQVIAPEISGIRCIAINSSVMSGYNRSVEENSSTTTIGVNHNNDDESELLVARENGSFVLYKMISFQNIVHFAQIRHTGGRTGVTITRIAYIHYCYDANLTLTTDNDNNNSNNSNNNNNGIESGIIPINAYFDEQEEEQQQQEQVLEGNDGETRGMTHQSTTHSRPLSLFVASYLSGQLVLYNGASLFPIRVHQRTGGAIWDLCVDRCYIYTAMGDGSWHQLRLVCSRANRTTTSNTNLQASQYRFDFELLRIVPTISGADRALCVHVNSHLQLVIGCDDSGNVNCWPPAREANVSINTISQSKSAQDIRNLTNTHRNSSSSSSNKLELLTDNANRRLTEHVSLWTRRLPEGMGLCVTTAGDAPSHLRAEISNNNSNMEDVFVTPTSAAIANTSSPSSCVTRCFVAPVVAIGTSTGDVVLLHAWHGHILHTFTQHKGPVTTIIAYHSPFSNTINNDNNNNSSSTTLTISNKQTHGSRWCLYASGWHESIRCYRCESVSNSNCNNSNKFDSMSTEWYPAEVKRRSHYHEAVQLLIAPHKELFLSASRDGTILYSALHALFTQPAMYVNVSTQQFNMCSALLPHSSPLSLHTRSAEQEHKTVENAMDYSNVNLLFQSRIDRVECFAASDNLRHWNPLFAYRLSGKFHLNKLWCEHAIQIKTENERPLLQQYIVMSTDERVVVAELMWRVTTNDQLTLNRITEILELPAGSGVVDAIFVSASQSHSAVLHDQTSNQVSEHEQYNNNINNNNNNGINSAKIIREDRVTTKNEKKKTKKNKKKEEEEEIQTESVKAKEITLDKNAVKNAKIQYKVKTSSSYSRLYLLKDNEIIFVKLTTGFPVIRTPLVNSGSSSNSNSSWHLQQMSSIRPTQIIYDDAKKQLLIFGLNGTLVLNVNDDGTPCLFTENDNNKLIHTSFMFVRQVPVLYGGKSNVTKLTCNNSEEDAITPFTKNNYGTCEDITVENNHIQKRRGGESEHNIIVGLAMPTKVNRAKPLITSTSTTEASNNTMLKTKRHAARYYAYINSDQPIALPKTLPQDTVFIAQIHPSLIPAFTESSNQVKQSIHAAQSTSLLFIARFSKGLLLVSEKDWKMVSRLSIEGVGIVHCSGNMKNNNNNYNNNEDNDDDAIINNHLESKQMWSSNNSTHNIFDNTNNEAESADDNIDALLNNNTHRSKKAQNEAEQLLKQQEEEEEEEQQQTKCIDEQHTSGMACVLVLERNLEKTLESLPLCWKVRRFGN